MLTRKLETVFTPTDAERAAIDALPAQSLSLKRNHDIVREGDSPGRCCVIVDGIACWFKLGGTGSRQILSFHIPGDIPDLQSLHLDVLDSSLMTVSPCQVVFIPHEPLRQLYNEFPRLNHVFWRWSLVDAAIFREWVMNLGGRPGESRIAHLLCEMFVRLQHVGLAEDDSCHIPMTQSELADATGLSAVHTNRVLQSLRAAKLITLAGSRLTVTDWAGLQEVGDFDPSYLHLGKNGTIGKAN